MDLINKNVYAIKIDHSVLPGIVYSRRVILRHLINSSENTSVISGGIPYTYIFSRKVEAENAANRLKRKMGYRIDRNYKKL
jgi:hypothetical protein